MSMFLGPIHYMMFGKIKTAAGRSRAIVEVFKAKYPAETAETVNAALPEGLVDFGNAKLEEMIGDAPIHGFLQSLIDRVEIAEAKLVTALLYRFPDEAEELLAQAFYGHGHKTAREETAKLAGGDPLSLYQGLMGQHYLEGMPCDTVSSYRPAGSNTMEITHTDCLHREKWESAGAPVHVMCKLMDQWALGAARAIDANFTLSRSSSIADGARSCRCTVSLPSN